MHANTSIFFMHMDVQDIIHTTNPLKQGQEIRVAKGIS